MSPLLDPRAAWMADGTCAQTGPDDWMWFPPYATGNDYAREVCDACPVRETCAQFALERPELDGIWGGTTTRDRQSTRMGIDWMHSWPDLADAIPPAYTHHIGAQLLALIESRGAAPPSPPP